MIETSTEWKSLSVRPGKIIPLVRLYYGAEGANDYISLSTKDITLDGENFIGLLIDIPEITQAIDVWSRKYSISSFDLQINNFEMYPGKRFSDFLEEKGSGADIGFENRKADVRLYIEGITSFANCFPFMTNGIIRNIEHNWEITIISIEDNTELARAELNNTVENSDATSGYVVPEQYVGKLKPIIYGDHRFTINSSTINNLGASNWRSSRDNIVTPARHLGGNQWLISDHEVKGLSTASGDCIWAYDSSINRFVEVVSWSIIQNTSAGCIISIDDDLYYDYRKPTGYNATYTDFNNPSNGVDDDVTTYASHDLTAADAVGAEYQLRYNFPSNDIDTADIQEVKLFARVNWDLPPAESTVDCWVGAGAVNKGSFNSYAETSDFQTHSGDLTTTYITGVEVHFEKVSDAGGWTTVTCYLYSAYLRVKYQNTKTIPIYFGGRGLTYGSWINNRGTINGYTEDHIDNNKSGYLVTNPAGIIESFLRDRANLGDSKINMDSLNILSNDLSSYKLNVGIVDRTLLSDLLAELIRECRSNIWWQPNGTIKAQTIENTYSSSDRVLNYKDLKNVDFERTKPEYIKTAVQVEYNWNVESYQSKTSIAEDTVQQTKYNITQTQSLLNYQSKYIQDPATAESLRDYLLAFWKQPHNIVSCTAGKEYMDIDIGDVIALEDVPYKVRGEDITINNTRSGQTIYKYWMVFYVKRKDRITLKAIQLHNLS